MKVMYVVKCTGEHRFVIEAENMIEAESLAMDKFHEDLDVWQDADKENYEIVDGWEI